MHTSAAMLQRGTLLFLFVAIFGHLLPLQHAVPVISPGDDTEVLEIDLNAIDNELDPAKDLIDLSFYGNAIYGMPDNELTSRLVANYTPDAPNAVNPEELGTYLEGDILIPTPAGSELTKNGVVSQSSRWPRGIVPFEIRGQFSGSDLALIQRAMDEYHQRTCIRFVPRRSESDYISIVSGSSGCWSSVGRVGGKQEVNLQSPGCTSKVGTPIHELMHAVGFLHEQNRHERDTFVSIQLQNVQSSAVNNFEKASMTNAFGVPYDYSSVMHYSANAFSQNGRPTIVALQPGGDKMGQRDGFSPFDVDKLNKMYDCGYGGSGSSGAPMPNHNPGTGAMPGPYPGGMGPGPYPGGMPGGYPGGMPGGYPGPMPGPYPSGPMPGPYPSGPMPGYPGAMPGPYPPGPYPGYMPGPVGGQAPGGGLIGGFLGGFLGGLGLAEEDTKATTTLMPEELVE